MTETTSRPAVRLATCRDDGEPLIFTFERPYLEFVCIVCGRWYEFLEPAGAPATPELVTRHLELLDQFQAGVRGPA